MLKMLLRCLGDKCRCCNIESPLDFGKSLYISSIYYGILSSLNLYVATLIYTVLLILNLSGEVRVSYLHFQIILYVAHGGYVQP